MGLGPMYLQFIFNFLFWTNFRLAKSYQCSLGSSLNVNILVIKAQWSKPGNKDLLAYIATWYKFCQLFISLARIQFEILQFISLSCLLTLLQFGIIPQSLSFMMFSILKHSGQILWNLSQFGFIWYFLIRNLYFS